MIPGRPLRRAYQRDPDAMAWWQQQEYPHIAARAAAAGATVYFADEIGRERGAPVRRARRSAGADDKCCYTLISAVTAKGGAPRFAVFGAAAADALTFTEFCARLMHGAPGPVYLVVDGHPAHRAQSVVDYAASTSGGLELYYLPAGY
jgi:hypothetical protein